MESNIIKIQGKTLILNGGDGIKDCPLDWDKAREWEEKANGVSNSEEYEEDEEDFFNTPRWRFDCGFKLDYDGGIVRISSRFYPPKTHYGPTWDGKCSVYILDEKRYEKEFNCETLEELKSSVDEYINGLVSKIKALF